jgi:hypothetical protein
MDKLCLVFDLDETILHYVDRATEEFINEDMNEESNDNENEVKDLIKPGDKVFFRPGFWKFIEYVKSKQGQIVLGIWTFGNKMYADKLKPYLERDGELFRFVYTQSDMKKGMLDKQLTYVVNRFDRNMRKNLGIHGRRTRSKRSHGTTELPKNIFIIDNLYTNIDHNINRKNGILVESFVDSNKPDTMFEELEIICESLLTDGKIPSEYLQNFKINGKKRLIASIGTIFDGGITPIESSSSSSTTSKSQSGGNKTLKAMKAMQALDIMLRKNKIKTQRLKL